MGKRGVGSQQGRLKKPLVTRLLFWLFVVSLFLYVAVFLVDAFGEGGLVGTYLPTEGKALSEAEMSALDARLGVGFIGLEFVMWVKESAMGNFGPKPVLFLITTVVLLTAWLVSKAIVKPKPDRADPTSTESAPVPPSLVQPSAAPPSPVGDPPRSGDG